MTKLLTSGWLYFCQNPSSHGLNSVQKQELLAVTERLTVQLLSTADFPQARKAKQFDLKLQQNRYPRYLTTLVIRLDVART